MWQPSWHTLLLWFLKIDEEKTTWTKFLPRSNKDAFSERTLSMCSMNSSGFWVYFRGDKGVMQIYLKKNFPVALLASSWRASHDSLPHCVLCRTPGWKAPLLIDLKYTLEPCTFIQTAFFFDTESSIGGKDIYHQLEIWRVFRLRMQWVGLEAISVNMRFKDWALVWKSILFSVILASH